MQFLSGLFFHFLAKYVSSRLRLIIIASVAFYAGVSEEAESSELDSNDGQLVTEPSQTPVNIDSAVFN